MIWTGGAGGRVGGICVTVSIQLWLYRLFSNKFGNTVSVGFKRLPSRYYGTSGESRIFKTLKVMFTAHS